MLPRPVRRTPLIALLLVMSLAVPVQAGATLSSVRVTGVALSASGAGLLALDVGTAGSPSLLVTGPQATLTVIDEFSAGSWRFPLDPEADLNSILANPDREETTVDLTDFTLTLEGLVSEDARTLAWGDGFAPEVRFDDRYEAEQVRDHVVEESHTVDRTDGFSSWRYYEYRSGDRVGVTSQGGAEVTGDGSFSIYFWGQALSWMDKDGTGDVVTGYTSSPSEGAAGPSGFIRDEHNRYAILTVTDGSLAYSQGSGLVRLFSDDVASAPAGAITFVEAQGTLPTQDGDLTASGGLVRADGGSYRFARGAQGLTVHVLDAPRTATGTNAVFSEAPGWQEPPGWTLAVGAAAAAVILALGYLYPAWRGRQTIPTGAGWMSRRADGYASMAAAAESAGMPRLAAFWMAWSLRAVPADPLRMVDLAILRAKCGDHRAALLLHETAHGWLVDAARGDHVAHNAYEAAKAAALLGRPAQALDWMRMALEADPGLMPRVSHEPAFASLRDTPDYASMTVGGA